jgi:hypothetical protein
MTEQPVVKPTSCNAFELISLLKGLDFSGFFENQQVNCQQTRSVFFRFFFYCAQGRYSAKASRNPISVCFLFVITQDELHFTSKLPALEIIAKIEETAKALGFVVKKQNFKVSQFVI